jgi:hypothetical protein
MRPRGKLDEVICHETFAFDPRDGTRNKAGKSDRGCTVSEMWNGVPVFVAIVFRPKLDLTDCSCSRNLIVLLLLTVDLSVPLQIRVSLAVVMLTIGASLAISLLRFVPFGGLLAVDDIARIWVAVQILQIRVAVRGLIDDLLRGLAALASPHDFLFRIRSRHPASSRRARFGRVSPTHPTVQKPNKDLRGSNRVDRTE